jgi:hypothetical protein
MADTEQAPGRVRAWILVQSDSPPDEAQWLYDNLVDEGGDGYVVIRADVVDSWPYNIVIPVDAESMDALRHVHRRILEFIPAKRVTVMRVVQHIPPVPQEAQGFITPDEFAAGRDKSLPAGRIHWSPGANAWG